MCRDVCLNLLSDSMNAATGATGTMPPMHGSPPHPGYPHPEGGGASLLQQQHDIGASTQNLAAWHGALPGMQSHTFARFPDHGPPQHNGTHPGLAPLQPGTTPHQESPLHPGHPHGGDLGASTTGQQHGMGSPNQWQIAALDGHNFKLNHSMSVPGQLPGQCPPQMHGAGDMRSQTSMSPLGQPSGHGTPMHGAAHSEALAGHTLSHSMSLPGQLPGMCTPQNEKQFLHGKPSGHGTPQDYGALGCGPASLPLQPGTMPQGSPQHLGGTFPGYFGASVGQPQAGMGNPDRQSQNLAAWHRGTPQSAEDSESDAGSVSQMLNQRLNQNGVPVPQSLPAHAATPFKSETPPRMPPQPEAPLHQHPSQAPHEVPPDQHPSPAPTGGAPPHYPHFFAVDTGACVAPPHQLPPQQHPPPQQAPETMTALELEARTFCAKGAGHMQANLNVNAKGAGRGQASAPVPGTTPHQTLTPPASAAPAAPPQQPPTSPPPLASPGTTPHQTLASPASAAPPQQPLTSAPPLQAHEATPHQTFTSPASAPPPQQPNTFEAHKQLPSMAETGALSEHPTTHQQSLVPADGAPPQHLPSAANGSPPDQNTMSAPASATPQHQPTFSALAFGKRLASVTPDSQKPVSPAAAPSPQQQSFPSPHQPVMQLD